MKKIKINKIKKKDGKIEAEASVNGRKVLLFFKRERVKITEEKIKAILERIP